VVYGKPKSGAELKAGTDLLKRGTVDLSALDELVEGLCTKLLYTFPDCTTKTLEELRKPKLDAWNRNKENSRAWLALNMMTEGRTGFRAFHEGTKECREADFLLLRRRLAEESTSFQEILDEVRFGLATEYLIETLLPLQEISTLLGYSDPGNFTHSFKRWSGMAPRDFRLEHQSIANSSSRA